MIKKVLQKLSSIGPRKNSDLPSRESMFEIVSDFQRQSIFHIGIGSLCRAGSRTGANHDSPCFCDGKGIFNACIGLWAGIGILPGMAIHLIPGKELYFVHWQATLKKAGSDYRR